MKNSIQWKKRYLDLAKQAASWSKDPSKKIGSVAIGLDGQVLSTGYNGFPRGIKDTEERYNNRELKYKFISHSEANCIYNACLTGTSLKGATIYVYGLPVCSECAKAIIQSGIKEVVIGLDEWVIPANWSESWNLTQEMFNEVGIDYCIIGENV